MADNFNEIKFRIIKLKTFTKLSTEKYSKDNIDFIEETISKFREAIVNLPKNNQNEFEEKVKNYNKNLNELIMTMESLLQFIRPKYTGKYKKTAWK